MIDEPVGSLVKFRFNAYFVEYGQYINLPDVDYTF